MVLCSNVIVVCFISVSHRFKLAIYLNLSINRRGPIPSSRFSHRLCCLISLTDAFLMRVCVSRVCSFSILNFQPRYLCCSYSSVWILQSFAFPCQVSLPAGHVCSSNAAATQLANRLTSICFSVSVCMEVIIFLSLFLHTFHFFY